MDGHRSSRPVTVILLLAAITNSALAESQPSYFVIGEPLVLTPPSRPTPITGIVWTHNTNLVAEWLDGVPEVYGAFKGRTTLDPRTGTLTISNTTVQDEGQFKVEFNNQVQNEDYIATAIKKVSTPVFVLRTLSCTHQDTECTFTCQGDSTGAKPVTYSWRKDQGLWQPEQESSAIIIQNEKMSGVTSISCRMKNPVSQEESLHVENPFFLEEESSSSAGLVAGLCLLLFVVVPGVGVAVWKREYIKNKLFGNPETSADKDVAEPMNEKGTSAEGT